MGPVSVQIAKGIYPHGEGIARPLDVELVTGSLGFRQPKFEVPPGCVVLRNRCGRHIRPHQRGPVLALVQSMRAGLATLPHPRTTVGSGVIGLRSYENLLQLAVSYSGLSVLGVANEGRN